VCARAHECDVCVGGGWVGGVCECVYARMWCVRAHVVCV